MATDKINALAKFLNVDADELSESRHDDCTFEIGRSEYLVLTDAEADARVRESIERDLWAFRSDFIARNIGIPELAEVLKTYQEKKCEDANDAIRALIVKAGNLDHFVSEAVSADGRGHFLAGYDGEENEAGEFFVYRVN